jgi:DNA primase large subunit
MERKSKTSGPVPLYLNKVNSDTKAIACAEILEACRPTHSQRLWLAGFLKFCGYDMSEVLGIIREHCQWADYNERITSYQVSTVFRQRQVGTSCHKYHTTPRVRKWDLTPVEVLRIRRQLSITLSERLCEENNVITYPHPERVGNFNSWAEFLKK